MEYIASQLAPLWKGVPNFYENKHLMELVKNATDSKLAIMTKNGNIYYVGDFEEDNGIMYSNSTYKRTRSWRDFSYGSWTQDIWETGNGMRDCTWVPLMWLDESKGEYVKLKSGKLDEAGEYAISRYGTVYWYSAYEDAFRHMSGASAYTAEGLALTYDEDSEMVTNEVVLFS